MVRKSLVTIVLTLFGILGVVAGVALLQRTGSLRPSGAMIIFGSMIVLLAWIKLLSTP